MKNFRKILGTIAITLLLVGCGGGGSTPSQTDSTPSTNTPSTTSETQGDTTTTPATTKQPQTSQTEGTAQLGNLAGARVEIYQIEDNGSFTLKWTETTSTGDS